MNARERRQQKSERRRLREAREAPGGTGNLDRRRTNARDHPVPFLYPVPLYYAPIGGCVAGVGGIVDGGAAFGGAQCASVRGFVMSSFMGCSFTVVSRVLEVAAAGLHVAVRAAVAAGVEVVAGAEAEVAAGAVGVVDVVVVDLNQIHGLPGKQFRYICDNQVVIELFISMYPI